MTRSAHSISRKAILYIRQSSTYQVSHHVESQRLQYAMQDRLHHLGWQEIEVVDEDLGRSAAGMVTRAGFERMVADVCLGKVAAVAAREVSRFARNSREWQQLVEVCRVVDTVLIDLDTVYSAHHSNDRFLLGLKRPDSCSTSCSTSPGSGNCFESSWTTDGPCCSRPRAASLAEHRCASRYGDVGTSVG